MHELQHGGADMQVRLAGASAGEWRGGGSSEPEPLGDSGTRGSAYARCRR